jgi:hypothetical protein
MSLLLFHSQLLLKGCSGVGFGICQRLLYQLSQSTPSDLFLGPHGESVDFDFPCEGLTLIMACRSKKRAQVARDQLFSLLDSFILNLRKQPGYDGHADTFRKNVQIDIHELDLGMLKSVGEFTRTVSAKCVPYSCCCLTFSHHLLVLFLQISVRFTPNMQCWRRPIRENSLESCFETICCRSIGSCNHTHVLHPNFWRD